VREVLHECLGICEATSTLDLTRKICSFLMSPSGQQRLIAPLIMSNRQRLFFARHPAAIAILKGRKVIAGLALARRD
jgi:hypothetical protein